MNINYFTLSTVLASLTLVSCYPFPEPIYDAPKHSQMPDRAQNAIEQQNIQARRETLARLDKLNPSNNNTQPSERVSSYEPVKSSPPPVTERTPEKPVTNTPPPAPKRSSYQYANPVPGKPGFVFSPYNNKVIDVRGIPQGTLVNDPLFAESEKKFFRVP